MSYVIKENDENNDNTWYFEGFDSSTVHWTSGLKNALKLELLEDANKLASAITILDDCNVQIVKLRKKQ